ncbi:conserved hypothetical protein [Orientia tsutsugamushi str. Boryong]|uniref:Uncharacterized protein n=1 Tax=Orientia tsutsugamushi (strain Boryong) TaxID=357244 RepID=A5CF49_ORITB|nr:conserved hypothetical protein [Orientia tsutsugamushi str. Boryong]
MLTVDSIILSSKHDIIKGLLPSIFFWNFRYSCRFSLIFPIANSSKKREQICFQLLTIILFGYTIYSYRFLAIEFLILFF